MRFLRRLSPWFGWALLLAPVTILLHELGHFAAGAALGFQDLEFHFSSVASGDTSDRPQWHNGVFGLAGPVVTGLFVLLGLYLSWRRPRSPFGYALAVAGASRFFVGVPYTIVNLVAAAAGRSLVPPAFDEYKAGEALGWSGDLTLGATSLIVLAVILWLLFRLPRGERLVAWLGLLGGTAAGWALWFAVGPLLLP